MADENNQNTTRSRLTLKLPTSINTQNLALKTGVEKKLGGSAVQVTIKGRKKEASVNDVLESGLSKSEMEARIRAVSSSNSAAKEIKTHEILSKVNKKPRKEEIKEEPKVVIEEKVAEKPKAPEPVKKQDHVIPDYKLDQFDVRNKIRNSVEVANRQKEEREKLSEERRKQEQERLAKEKEERERKKPKKPVVATPELDQRNSIPLS